MAQEEFNKTSVKADRWFRAAIVFALLFGATYSLYSLFNWIFFCATAYAFFMSYYLLPQQPKIFQQNRQKPGSGPRSRQPFTGMPNSDVPPMDPMKRIKRIVFGIAGGIFGLFFLLILIGIFFGDPVEEGEQISVDQSTQESGELTADEMLTMGDNFFNEKKFDSADWYYQKALDMQPDNYAAVYGKGIVLYETNRKDQAMATFIRSYEGGYRNAWLSWVLADMRDKQGQTTEAIRLYKESIEQDSVNTDSYTRLAQLEPANASKYLEMARRHKDN